MSRPVHLLGQDLGLEEVVVDNGGDHVIDDVGDEGIPARSVQLAAGLGQVRAGS